MYSGAEVVAPLCTLALTRSAEQLLTGAVAPYRPLLKVYRGKATFQLQHTTQHDHSAAASATSAVSLPVATTTAAAETSAFTPSPPLGPASPRVLVDVQLPASVLDYRILLLVPQLDAQSYPELLSLLTHLQGCGCELTALTVCCITAARPALWSVMSVYPALALITVAVDEVRHGQLVPGVRQLEARSTMHGASSRQHSDPEAANATQPSQTACAEQPATSAESH